MGSYKYREEYFKKHKSPTGYYKCAYCGKYFKKEQMDVDHIIPTSRMGINAGINNTLACIRCNRSKKNTLDSRILKGYSRKMEVAVIELLWSVVCLPFKICGFIFNVILGIASGIFKKTYPFFLIAGILWFIWLNSK